MVFRPMRFAALATLVLGSASTAAQAADLYERAPRRILVEEDVVSVIVVPDCWERFGAVLLACAPRGTVGGPDAHEVDAILSTVQRPRRAPYPQLLDRP